MNLSRSPQFLKVGALAAFGCMALARLSSPAEAQAPPPPTPEQARAFLRLDLAYQVLQSPLTLKVENSSLEKIAEQVQKSLVANHSTPTMEIQVRNARSVRLKFDTKNSTVGKVLRSSGALAGVQLWIFSDHFLLAPEESLLPDEKEALDRGMMAKAPGSATERSWLIQFQQRSLASFISDEIKGLQKGKAGAGASDKITFNQLSPESQAMLQILLASSKDDFLQGPSVPIEIISALGSFSLSNTTLVGFEAPIPGSSPNTPQLELTFDKGTASWSTDGTGKRVSTGGRSSTPSSRPTPPFLDPSAGDS